MICKTPVTIVDNKAKTNAAVSDIANTAIAKGIPIARLLMDCVVVIILFILNFQKKMKLIGNFFYLIRLFLLFFIRLTE